MDAQLVLQVDDALGFLALLAADGRVAVVRLQFEDLSVEPGGGVPIVGRLRVDGLLVCVGEVASANGIFAQDRSVVVVGGEAKQVIKQPDRGVVVLGSKFGTGLDVHRPQSSRRNRRSWFWRSRFRGLPRKGLGGSVR